VDAGRHELQWKVWCFVVVFLPRVLMSCALCYVGAMYICRSESKEAMILNTLSVLFIVEIDDTVYKVFTSGSLKVHMENVKGISLHPTNADRLVSFMFASVFSPILAVFMSWFFVYLENSRCDRTEAWS